MRFRTGFDLLATQPVSEKHVDLRTRQAVGIRKRVNVSDGFACSGLGEFACSALPRGLVKIVRDFACATLVSRPGAPLSSSSVWQREASDPIRRVAETT